MFKCAVNADLFARANLARSDEPTRYYLNGVYVTPHEDGGALLVGTNGHWLVAIHDPRGVVEGSGIVSLSKRMISDCKSLASDARSPFGHRTERVVVVGDNRAMVVLSSQNYKIRERDEEQEIEPRGETLALLLEPNQLVISAQFSEVTIDGKFPDYKRVIPDDVDGNRPLPTVDPKYIALAVKAITQDRKGAVRFMPGENEGAPIVVVPSNEPFGWKSAAVVMPMRGSSTIKAPTFWKGQQ